MKKGFIPVMLSCLLAAPLVLTSCGGKDNPGEKQEDNYTVSITNKDALTAAWTKNGATRTVNIAVEPATNVQSLINDGTITITSDHPEIVNVQGKVLSAVGVGTAKITVKCGDSSDFVNITVAAPEHGTEADDPLTVAEAVQKAKDLGSGVTSTVSYYVSGIVKSNSWDTGYKNGTMYLVEGSNEFELYRYTMDDACTVEPGNIKPGMIVKAYGTIQNYQGKTFEMPAGCKVVDAQQNSIPCTDITLDAAAKTIEVDEVLRLSAVAVPETTTDELSYTSDNTAVATVDAKGRVIGVSAGSANIKVKAGSIEKTVAITVAAPVAGNKKLEQIDHVIMDTILPKSGVENGEYSISQKVPGETEQVKTDFNGKWCINGSYEQALTSLTAADKISATLEGLYFNTVRIDFRKYKNAKIYATADLTGNEIAGEQVFLSDDSEHNVWEYKINSKTWSMNAGYDGNGYIHSIQYTIAKEMEQIPFTSVEYQIGDVSLPTGSVITPDVVLADAGVEGVTLAYASDNATAVSVDAASGKISVLAESGEANITVTATKGEVVKTDSIKVTAAGSTLLVDAPAAGNDYYLGINQTQAKKFLFATGTESSYYGGATQFVNEAGKVQLVAATDGKFNLKVTLADGQTVKYVNSATSGDNVNVKLQDEAKTLWKVDAEKRLITTEISGLTTSSKDGEYGLCTWSSNSDFRLSKTTTFPAWFYTLGARPAAESVTLDKTELALEVGANETLTANVAPLNADAAVTWASDAESVATVDQTGKVTAVAAGTANITATTANGKVGTCAVTVSAKAAKTEPYSVDMPMTGFDGTTASNYKNYTIFGTYEGIEYATYAANMNNGQIRGGKTKTYGTVDSGAAKNDGNWYFANTTELEDKLTSIEVYTNMTVTDSNKFKDNLYLVYGDESELEVVSLSESKLTFTLSGNNKFTLDTSSYSFKYFKIMAVTAFTAGTVTDCGVKLNFTPAAK